MLPPAALKTDKPNQVYEHLRDMIIKGRLAPGVRVVEADIADRIGVSRTPVREAIRRLLKEGFIVASDAGRRVESVVASLTREDVEDLYLIMAALEGGAVLSVRDMQSNERRQLVQDLRRLEAAFEREARRRPIDFDRLFECHNAFHRRLVRVSPRPRLQALLESVRPQVDRYEWVYAPMVGPDYSATFAEHAEIIRAVSSGSGRRVQRAVAKNWERGAERLETAIERFGSRGSW